MARPRLTKSIVERTKPGDDAIEVWCGELTGFMVRVYPTGRRVYYACYRNEQRNQRRYKIGKHGDDCTIDLARREAARVLAAARGGGDPSAERKAGRANGRTFADLCDKFLRDWPVKAGSRRVYTNMIEKHLRPTFGDCQVAAIGRADVSAMHSKITNTGARCAANRTVELLRSMMNRAAEWGLVPAGHDNPANKIRKNREEPRERFLDPDEREWLANAVAECEDRPLYQRGSISPGLADGIRFAILTGMRRGEVAGLRWEYIDRALVTLPDSKTGRKVLHLSSQAVELLESVRPTGARSGFVFVSRRGGSIARSWVRGWDAVREAAGMDGADGRPPLRTHDLRHTFVSAAIEAGVNLETVGGLVGHKSVRSTARYRHLRDEKLRAAAQEVGDVIGAARTRREKKIPE